MDNLQAFVATMVMTLFIPCTASTFVIIKERGIGVGLAIVCFVASMRLLRERVINCRSAAPAHHVLRG